MMIRAGDAGICSRLHIGLMLEELNGYRPHWTTIEQITVITAVHWRYTIYSLESLLRHRDHVANADARRFPAIRGLWRS